MTFAQRYNLIKKICEQKNEQQSIAQLPYTDQDLQDEFCRFNTTLEPPAEKWENQFLQNLVFGS